MTFDPNRPFVMASAKTVQGHALPVGHPLTVVENPSAPGEVDEAMAKRLHASKLAAYRDELHATPVETPEQERNRLAAERLRDAQAVAGTEAAPQLGDALVPTDDLNVWQEDDHRLNRRKGDRVTNDDLRAIAAREGTVVEGDDNKADLQRKIMEHRAGAATVNGYNAETEGAGGQGDTPNSGVTTAGTFVGADSGADSGPDGDAHGEAGEGPSDAE